MKKILLNYLKPQVRVYQVNTENFICLSGEGSGDRQDYENDDTWTD